MNSSTFVSMGSRVLKRRQLSLSTSVVLAVASVCLLSVQVKISSQSFSQAHDPGVRGGDPGAGGPLPGLTPQENEYFTAGQLDFNEAEEVIEGMGPRMNLDSCGGCHAQPAIGGTSPAINPQVSISRFASGFGNWAVTQATT